MTGTGTPLTAVITAEIETGGPMSVARYMGLALGHPAHGYYMTGEPFGARGDFVTAPEISQMFGELIGLWCADTWSKMAIDGPVMLAELGPGRGTLMADALRAARASPAFLQAADIHLVETSPALRRRQEKTLATWRKPIHWHDRFEDLPHGPLLVIANELFDALPAHQFEVRDGVWHERCVVLAPEGGLAMALSPDPVPPGIVPADFAASPKGSIFEVAPIRERLAGAIAARLVAHGGAGLIIDYGHGSPGLGDTLQAVSAHEYADPLAAPGEADITTHVDFSALVRAATDAGAIALGPIEMGPFLSALGVQTRAAALKSSAPAATAADIDTALHRLTAAEQMGSLFKVLVLTGPGGPVPAPFA
ncbi:SAM-dependent methyltransferase, MidA [hydrothermal vent metagenome]|uniref:SAM-dependent methyltransferase, MidA n=1 Tax=hydrothermal vent metagenome TaxID=652676 RepID=A0A3B0T6X4_9ZZZZ